MRSVVTRTPTAAEAVAEFYREARELLLPDLRAGRVIGLPGVTAAGLEVAGAIIRARLEISIPTGRLLYRASVIPAASRRRRVLSALAKWLPGVPSFYLFRNETWFNGRIVREVVESSAGACIEAEAAGLLALMILAPRIEANLRG